MMYSEILKQISDNEPAVSDSTEQRILDATLTEASAHGVHKLTMESIAQRAGLNRTTIYRRFGSMDKLLALLAMREARAMATQLRHATQDIEEPKELFIEGFVAAITFAKAHPLISRAATYEPGKLIETGLANDGALLQLGARFMADTIRWAQSKGELLHLKADSTGDTMARLFASFILLPAGNNDLNDAKAAKKYAKTTLIPMLFGPA